MASATLPDGLVPSILPLPQGAQQPCFPLAGRAGPEEFRRQLRVIEFQPFLQQALDAMPGMVMILNRNRQILAANQTIRRLLDTPTEHLWEKRPGEIIGCIRAADGADGCGTARHCMVCGALQAMRQCQQQGGQVVRECRILARGPSGPAPLDLRVTATPFTVETEPFYVVAIEDISQAKRVGVLQRTFFHDVLNLAGCMEGYAQYLQEEGAGDRELCQRMVELSGELIEQIRAHRELTEAEGGDLKPKPTEVDVPKLLEDLRARHQRLPEAADRPIAIEIRWHGTIQADRHLLQRVLGNMLKNALEATAAGNKVAIGCREQGGRVVFTVHNVEVMPDEVQLQIFQRSFSTKQQPGHGVGTYSMKLLGERYLGGTVDFVSREGEGTTFALSLPLGPAR